MKDLIADNDLPPVVFHSLRHSSITYKLKLNGGDIKAVQGDSGHSQAQMVTDQYSHILDENRRQNAQLVERAFYQGTVSFLYPQERGHKISPSEVTSTDQKERPSAAEQAAASGIDAELLMKVLSNPEMVKVLQMLSKTVG